MHGYQLIQEISQRTDGAWAPSPGSIYPTLSRLATEGLVRTEETGSRSVVHLTEQGKQYVRQHRHELDAVWSTAAEEDDIADLRNAGRELLGAVAQIAYVGSRDQRAEAISLLNDTRRRLYLLLANDDDRNE